VPDTLITMNRMLAAIRFLTILPLPGRWGSGADDLAGSVPWFPWVGLGLGGLAAAAAWAMAAAVPPLVAAAVLVVLLAAFSGGLHLDGLADTADGVLSSRPRDQILEIMKDSHVGVMGVIAVVAVLLVKFAALASLPPRAWWPVVLLVPLAGRAAIVVHVALLRYARPAGLGAVFFERRHRVAAVCGLLVLAAATWLVCESAGLGLRLAAAIWTTCMAVSLLLAAYFQRKIGGATGDTLGAACEIVETVPVLVAAVWLFEKG